jgi:hypothetical protein
MIADRTQVVIMMRRIRLHSFLPPKRSSNRPIKVATPLSLSPAESTKIAPRAITALLPNPRSTASAGVTVPVIASTTGIESAVASRGISLLMKRIMATTNVAMAIQA